MSVKNVLLAFLSILLISGCAVSHPGKNQSTSSDEGFWYEQDSFIQGRALKLFPKKIDNKTIKGVCVIQESNDFFDSYCNNIEMALMDKGKNIVAKTKTDSNGTFRFASVSNEIYKIKVLDKRFSTVSESIFVTAGAEVLVHLKAVEPK